MIRLPQVDILYHGSYTEISRIDLSQCRNGLDFGKGFYVTSSLKQAVSYIPASVRKAKRRGLLADISSESDGRVSVYQFCPDPNLFIHYFDDADEEWLHFVACNRSRELFPELRKKYASVDIIGGKVADDQTAITLNNYVAGAYGTPGTVRADRTAIELLEPERLQDQFCFRTAEAVCSLTFIRSERYADIR